MPSIKFSDADHCFKLPSKSEMIEMDTRTINNGTPAIDLMERAGKSVYAQMVKGLGFSKETHPLILCGPGNNGGDGLVIAQLMLETGISPVVIVAHSDKYTSDFHIQYHKFIGQGGAISVLKEESSLLTSAGVLAVDQFADRVKSSNVIIDALLGTGQNRSPAGGILNILLLVSDFLEDQQVAAVDIPTGVNGDTGEVYDTALRATHTFCIELVKRGLTQCPGRQFSGVVTACSIEIDTSSQVEFCYLSPDIFRPVITRPENSHKGTFGEVLVIGGCSDMPGAPILAARGALFSGAGTVRVAVLSTVMQDVTTPEIFYTTISAGRDSDNSATCFSSEHFKEISPVLMKAQALAVGPGIGTSEVTTSFLEGILKTDKPAVIDADALNIVSKHRELLSLLENRVITPHPGEAARLLEMDIDEIQKDRFSAALKLSKLTKAVVILKGAGTIICSDGHGFASDYSNSFLSVPGAGDILTGIVSSLLAQGEVPFMAACKGVLTHNLAADYASDYRSRIITASNLAAQIPFALQELSRGGE